MENHMLIVGLADKDSKKQEITTKNAIDIIKRLMLKQGIYGYTMLNDKKGLDNIVGGYKHNSDGYYVEENSIIIMLFCVENIQISNLISDIKVALNQESVTNVVLNAEVKFE